MMLLPNTCCVPYGVFSRVFFVDEMEAHSLMYAEAWFDMCPPGGKLFAVSPFFTSVSIVLAPSFSVRYQGTIPHAIHLQVLRVTQRRKFQSTVSAITSSENSRC